MNIEKCDRATFPGTDCLWPFISGNFFASVQTVLLDDGIKVEVSGGKVITCRKNKLGDFPVNFEPMEILLLTERPENSRVGAIAIDFITPVLAVGAQLAVDIAAKNRPFLGIMTAFSEDGTKHEITSQGSTTKARTPDAIFLGATCFKTEKIKRIEFDVRPNGALAMITQFAISSLKIKKT